MTRNHKKIPAGKVLSMKDESTGQERVISKSENSNHQHSKVQYLTDCNM